MIAFAAAVPALVVLAAERTQRFERGVVGFRLHRVFDVHAGPYRRHDEMEFAGVYEDGRLVKVRILHQEVGGKETDAQTKAQTAASYAHPAPLDVFARPFDPAHLNEYTYELADARTVRFRALVRDAAHGDGTFALDSDGDVVSMAYSPVVMPRYARSGTVADQRAQVLPAYWTIVEETHHYGGRYAIFSGGADVTIEQSHFVRFATEADALAALDGGRL